LTVDGVKNALLPVTGYVGMLGSQTERMWIF